MTTNTTFDRETALKYLREALDWERPQGCPLPRMGLTPLDIIRHLHGDEVADRMPKGPLGPPPRRGRR